MDFAQIPHVPAKTSPYPYRLMAPGPVAVHPKILEVLALPQIHHRTPEFEKILTIALQRLRKVFQTEQPVFVLSCTGTGAMEAAIVNTLSPGDKVLILETGKFGERWAKISQVYGLALERMTLPWGHPVNPEAVRQALQKDDYRAVLCQACETSTGVLNPIREIGHIVREHKDTLLIVDGITAVGTIPMPMDQFAIDVLVAGSQKAFMLPTGLGMLALSEKAWSANIEAKLPRFYWDLAAERKANETGQTNFSSNVSLIRGLNTALELMLNPSLAQHLKRLQDLASVTRQAGEFLGLKVFPLVPSTSLTAFLLPPEVNAQKVRLHLEEKYNITVAEGQDQYKSKLIRIGHMGAITNEDAIETMRCLGLTLRDLHPLMFSKDLADRAAQLIADGLK